MNFILAVGEPLKKWSCYECNKTFYSSAQLQQHLSEHDDLTTGYGSFSDDDEKPSRKGKASSRQPVAKKRNMKKGKGVSMIDSVRYWCLKAMSVKNFKYIILSLPYDFASQETENIPPQFQNWKKKKTSIYLNK